MTSVDQAPIASQRIAKVAKDTQSQHGVDLSRIQRMNTAAEATAIETGRLFTDIRRGVFVALILLSGGTMGIAIDFSTMFSSNFHGSFNTFSIIAPATTIVILIIILLRSTPCWDCVSLATLAILWLAMGAWSTDVIGGIQCEALGGQQTPTKHGQTSYQAWCREMKIIEAFSWANFGILALSIIVIIILVVRLFSIGHQGVWGRSVAELEWFSNPYSRFANGMGGMGGMNGMGGMGGMGTTGGMSTMAGNPFSQPLAAGSQTSALGMANGATGVPATMATGQPIQQQAGGVQYVKQVPGHSVVVNGAGIPGGAGVQQLPTHTSRHGRRRSHSVSSSR